MHAEHVAHDRCRECASGDLMCLACAVCGRVGARRKVSTHARCMLPECNLAWSGRADSVRVLLKAPYTLACESGLTRLKTTVFNIVLQ